MRHCEKSQSLVCLSVMLVDMVVMHVYLDVNQLGSEVFSGEGWRTNRGAKEA